MRLLHTHTIQSPAGVVLVTDAMCAMGLGPGSHSLGNMKVEVANGAARLQGASTLAGRSAPLVHLEVPYVLGIPGI